MVNPAIEENIFMARVSEQAERYIDMVEFLKPVVQEKASELSMDERNLLSVAFKNLISSKRVAWRTIISLEQNQKYARFMPSIKEYKN